MLKRYVRSRHKKAHAGKPIRRPNPSVSRASPRRRRTYDFFIEYRLHGYARGYVKDLILDVAKKFRIKGVTKNRAVPHITLYGPSETNDIREVVREVKAVGQKYTLVPFQIRGFDYFDKQVGKVIYIDITPSAKLEQLRWELSRRLRRISTSQPQDKRSKCEFHTTVAFKDIDKKFKKYGTTLNQERTQTFTNTSSGLLSCGKTAQSGASMTWFERDA